MHATSSAVGIQLVGGVPHPGHDIRFRVYPMSLVPYWLVEEATSSVQ